MAESIWTGVCLFLQVWLSVFIGKCNFRIEISSAAQGFFEIRQDFAVTHKQYLNHTKFLAFVGILHHALQDVATCRGGHRHPPFILRTSDILPCTRTAKAGIIYFL